MDRWDAFFWRAVYAVDYWLMRARLRIVGAGVRPLAPAGEASPSRQA